MTRLNLCVCVCVSASVASVMWQSKQSGLLLTVFLMIVLYSSTLIVEHAAVLWCHGSAVAPDMW